MTPGNTSEEAGSKTGREGNHKEWLIKLSYLSGQLEFRPTGELWEPCRRPQVDLWRARELSNFPVCLVNCAEARVAFCCFEESLLSKKCRYWPLEVEQAHTVVLRSKMIIQTTLCFSLWVRHWRKCWRKGWSTPTDSNWIYSIKQKQLFYWVLRRMPAAVKEAAEVGSMVFPWFWGAS